MHVATTPLATTVRTAATGGLLVAGIAGASGYAGRELARLLAGHPAITLGQRQARSEGYDALDCEALAGCDIVFLCLPHGESATFGNALAHVGTPVVDLGSDFRLDRDWAYGLTELARRRSCGAARVANPGLLRDRRDPRARAAGRGRACSTRRPRSTASRASRAPGAQPSEKTHLTVGAGRRAAVQPDRAPPRRRDRAGPLGRLAGEPRRVTFTPHLAPHSRGLEVTCYARLTRPLAQAEAETLYRDRYAGEPFVRSTQAPHPGLLHGRNACRPRRLGRRAHEYGRSRAAALDNLVKGAAGQALQNANLDARPRRGHSG